MKEFIITSGSLPASSDADKFFPIFTATTQPVNITFVQYYGGDSGEYANLVLVPPTVVLDGTTGAGDIPGTISMTPAQYLAGGTWTIDKPGTLGAAMGAGVRPGGAASSYLPSIKSLSARTPPTRRPGKSQLEASSWGTNHAQEKAG